MAHQVTRWLAFGALAALVVVGLTGCLFGGCPPDPRAGGLYASGDNWAGQLGLGDNTQRNVPTLVPLPDRAAAADGGLYHSLVVLQNRDVYAFGWNQYGQLGLGDTTNRNVPTKVTLPGRAAAVAAGGYHSLVLLGNGDVTTFGGNVHGQLGLGDNADRNVPTKVTLPGRAVAVAAGGFHSLVVLENGDVYAFGWNQYGQLGVGDDANRNVPTKVTLPGRAVAAAAGWEHSVVLLQNGDVYAFGRNDYGQLGLGYTSWSETVPRKVTLPDRPAAVSASYWHTLVLLENGHVYAFGMNLHGQLGLGYTSFSEPVPTKVSLPGRAVAAVGTKAWWSSSLVLLENGDLYGFGSNRGGELGLGDTLQRNNPTKVTTLPGPATAVSMGGYHSFVIVP